MHTCIWYSIVYYFISLSYINTIYSTENHGAQLTLNRAPICTNLPAAMKTNLPFHDVIITMY